MRPDAFEQPRVLSRLPGRLRVHLPGWEGGGRDEIEAGLRGLGGVDSARANPLTGNVLIGFDPRVITEKDLLAALARLVPGRPGARGRNEFGGDGHGGRGSTVLRAGLRGLLGHALVDTLFYTVTFAEPFGLPLAGLGVLHLGFDVVAWGAALAPLLGEDRAPCSRSPQF